MTAPTYAQFRKNCIRAARIGHDLRREGFAVICPGENALYRPAVGDLSWRQWLSHDVQLVERADCVYRILPDPAGRTSKGAEREVRYAHENGIPVFTEPRELRAYGRELRRRRSA